MKENSKSRKRTPYWLAMIIGTLVTCIVSNITTLTYQIATDNSWWTSFDRPPSGALRIINADDYDIWVEARSGKIFTATINCSSKNKELCWKEVQNISEIPQEWTPLSRGDNCNVLKDGIFPLNPDGRIIECVYSDSGELTTRDENYFALMADGSVKYWAYVTSHWMVQRAYSDLSTIFLPFLVGVMISLVYLFNHVKMYVNRTKA